MAYIVKGEVYRRLGTGGDSGKDEELVRVVSVFKQAGVRTVTVAKLYGDGTWVTGTAESFENKYVLYMENRSKRQEAVVRQRAVARKAGAQWQG